MSDRQVNGRTIKVSDELQMVTVLQRPGQSVFGDALPIAEETFNAPQDGTLTECIEKAEAWANEN